MTKKTRNKQLDELRKKIVGCRNWLVDNYQRIDMTGVGERHAYEKVLKMIDEMQPPMQDAKERAGEMMKTPFKTLPELAKKFVKRCADEVGLCGEVIFTAFAVYAQLVENLPCEDPTYKATDKDREWFSQQSEAA